jgi:aryl carrier-like protein
MIELTIHYGDGEKLTFTVNDLTTNPTLGDWAQMLKVCGPFVKKITARVING